MLSKYASYVYYPPGYNNMASDILMYVACFIIIVTCIVLGWYFRMKTIEKLSDFWFKNKRMNYRHEDKLHKDGLDTPKEPTKPILTRRELNDMIIKKFMK